MADAFLSFFAPSSSSPKYHTPYFFTSLNPFRRRLSNFRESYLLYAFLAFVEVFVLQCHAVCMNGIHHFRHETERYTAYALHSYERYLYDVYSCSATYGFTILFLAHMFRFDDNDNYDKQIALTTFTVDGFLFVLFQSVDNIWCQRQAKYNWLATINWAHSLCFSPA